MRLIRTLKAPRSELLTLMDCGLVSTTQSQAIEHLLALRRNAYGFEHPTSRLRSPDGPFMQDDEKLARQAAYGRAAAVVGAGDLALVYRVAVDGESRRQVLSLDEVKRLRRALDRLVSHFGDEKSPA